MESGTKRKMELFTGTKAWNPEDGFVCRRTSTNHTEEFEDMNEAVVENQTPFNALVGVLTRDQFLDST